MRLTVLLGFAAVVALMVLVGAISLHQISSANDSITTIVEVNNAKIELANTMRESIRLRQISLNSMLAMEDPFERDDEFLLFNKLAEAVSPTYRETFATIAQFAELHRDIIAQFGRFPHRNKVLGRTNTPEEDEYLAGDSPDFGQGA